jgi:alpha-tubulin suppressor-like RCC1 family protein
MRDVRAALSVLLLGAAAACDEGGYSVVVSFDPTTLADEVSSVEVAVIASCDEQPSAGGDPTDAIRLVTVTRAGGEALGHVEPGSYGLYGRGRSRATCEVVAAGCEQVTVEAGGEGAFEVVLHDSGGPGCPAGLQCLYGTCTTEDADVRCGDDSECDDGEFCDGEERCDPDSFLADASGCVPGSSPCLAEQVCDEGGDRCRTQCDLDPDADDDGAAAAECGGDDCDDAAASVHPGATELCNTRDDDCDDAVDEGFALETDAANCGSCGNVCTADHAVASCEAGGCVYRCDLGWDDCNREGGDGCEAELAVDPDNCGACGVACLLGCSGSACDPVDVVGLAAGGAHACALEASGLVLCWGANDAGQLGDGLADDRPGPGLVAGIDDALEIAAGASHSCARLGGGQVVCWGANENGQLGDGTTFTSAVPVTIGGLADASQLALGNRHSCAREASGEVLCWGANDLGQIGDNTGASQRTSPTAVRNVDDAAHIAAGQDHTCVARTAGGASCWGTNLNGQLGNGESGGDEGQPVSVVGAASAVGVASGGAHSCLWTGAGAVQCWGCDDVGQLGDGAAVPTDTCSCPSGSAGCSLGAGAILSMAAVDALDAGAAHACAVLSDGSASCWGDNGRGQLGDGSTTTAEAPTAVPGLSLVEVVAAGDDFTCALASGAVLCWGRNDRGQLGDGLLDDRGVPGPVAGLD